MEKMELGNAFTIIEPGVDVLVITKDGKKKLHVDHVVDTGDGRCTDICPDRR